MVERHRRRLGRCRRGEEVDAVQRVRVELTQTRVRRLVGSSIAPHVSVVLRERDEGVELTQVR